MVQAPRADPPVDGVELVLGHQERVVLGADLLAVAYVGVVEADVVGDRHHHELGERRRARQIEQLGEEGRRLLLVLGGDDRVVEGDGHEDPSVTAPPYLTQPATGTRRYCQDRAMADDAVLSGHRVMMRAPRIDDAEALFAEVASDPEVTRYLSWTRIPTSTRRAG